MWVLTTHGFFSAVEHRTDKTQLFVRARSYDDALYLAAFKAKKIDYDTPDDPETYVVMYERSDYPWRVQMSKTWFAEFMAAEALGIDYGNFKSAVTKRQGQKRHDIYSRVWAILLGIEDLSSKKRPKPAPKPFVPGEYKWHNPWPAAPEKAYENPTVRVVNPNISYEAYDFECGESLKKGRRSWRCQLDFGHEGKHRNYGGKRTWN